MEHAFLEHLNITASDPQKTASMLGRLFNWSIRWEGPSKNNGFTVHVGTDKFYLALYNAGEYQTSELVTYKARGGLNHVGVVVDDYEGCKSRVIADGFTPTHEETYEPGRRFYFTDPDGVEYEVVNYQREKDKRPNSEAEF